MAESLYADLFIVDEEYTNYYSKYSEIGNSLQEKIEKYSDLMKTLQMEKGISGGTADMFFEFTDLVSSSLQEHITTLTSYVSESMPSYINEIDIADDILYGED